MKDKEMSAYIKAEVMKLYQEEQETGKKTSKALIVVVTLLIVLPLFLPAVLSVWHKELLGLGITVSVYGIAIIVVLLRKQHLYAKFYQVKEVEDKITIIPVEENDFLEKLYQASALTYFQEPNEELLKFLYNWLKRLDALKEETLNIYTFQSKDCMEKFGVEGASQYDFPMMCIHLGELQLTEKNLKTFSEQHFLCGGRYLDDIIK